jgi:hypothetical protein
MMKNNMIKLGVGMSSSNAKKLFDILTNDMEDADDVKPLAHVRKGNSHKVIMEPEDGWEIVVCNAMFLNDGKDEPLRVRRR